MLLIGDHIYFINDKGIGMCLEAQSGAEVWKERIGGAFSASPLYADGRMYFFDQAGKTTVLAPGNEFRVLAENSLEGSFMASPAAAGKVEADGSAYATWGPNQETTAGQVAII